MKGQPISSINLRIALIINVGVSLNIRIHMNDDFPHCICISSLLPQFSNGFMSLMLTHWDYIQGEAIFKLLKIYYCLTLIYNLRILLLLFIFHHYFIGKHLYWIFFDVVLGIEQRAYCKCYTIELCLQPLVYLI